MDNEDIDGISAGNGKCFEAEPTDLPMGNFYIYNNTYDRIPLIHA